MIIFVTQYCVTKFLDDLRPEKEIPRDPKPQDVPKIDLTQGTTSSGSKCSSLKNKFNITC